MVVSQTVCPVCDGTEYVLRQGEYFCIMCNTQSQELGMETVMDDETIPLDVQGRNDAITIGKKSKNKGRKRNISEEVRWGTAEGLSWILRGWVDQLKDMGVDVEIAVIQLWSLYLRELKMGFERKGEEGLIGKENLRYRERWNLMGGPPGLLDFNTLAAYKKRRIKVEEEGVADEEEYGETLQDRRRRNKKRKSFYKKMSSVGESGGSEMSPSVCDGGVSSSGAESESEYSEGGFITEASTLSTMMERYFDRTEFFQNLANRNILFRHSGVEGAACLPTTLHMKQVAALITLAVIGRPNSTITIADMVRLFNSESLSWRSAPNFLPKSYNMVNGETTFFRGLDTFTTNMLAVLVFRLASFLHKKSVKHLYLAFSHHPWSKGSSKSPHTFKPILSRYLRDLCLPSALCKDITQCFKRLYLTTMTASLQPYLPKDKSMLWALNKFPLVSKRILALILLALKYHCGLDDQFEVYMAHNIDKMALMDKGSDVKYFDLLSWLRLSKLRLDLLMSSNHCLREQYQSLAHVGTPPLSLRALATKLRLEDQVNNNNWARNSTNTQKRFSELTKLMTELTVSVKPIENNNLCLDPLTENTQVVLRSGVTKPGVKKCMERLLSMTEGNMRVWYDRESCTLRNILKSNHGVPYYSDVRKKLEKKVKLVNNWIVTQHCPQGSRMNRMKTDRLFRRQKKVQFMEMISSGWNKKSKFHVPNPKVKAENFFLAKKVYWFAHHYTQKELTNGYTKTPVLIDKKLITEQLLNVVPSNFAWILKYFASYAHLPPLELLEELNEIEKLILVLDPQFFGLPMKLKPHRKLLPWKSGYVHVGPFKAAGGGEGGAGSQS